jgi:serine/threonine protein kinase HipA of HipAB toxin-antitoxin module
MDDTLGMQEIPGGNIVKRWTVDARDTVPVHLIENDRAAENSKSFRTSELFIVAMKFQSLVPGVIRLLK